MKKESGYFMSQNPQYVAEQIKNIIEVMVSRMSPEARQRAYPTVMEKVKILNIQDISNKKSPGGASIGVSISLIKNILNGRDPIFIKLVMDELLKGK